MDHISHRLDTIDPLIGSEHCSLEDGIHASTGTGIRIDSITAAFVPYRGTPAIVTVDHVPSGMVAVYAAPLDLAINSGGVRPVDRSKS